MNHTGAGRRTCAITFRLFLLVTAVSAGACAPKTKYVPPAAEVPDAFLENGNWKLAEPADAVLRGTWWELFGDASLDTLQRRIDLSNQNLKAAEAQFAAARAAVRGARSALYPNVTLAPAITRTRQSLNRASSPSRAAFGDFILPLDASYEADVWGRIRQTIEASRTTAQASAADLESARLSLHAELALDYFRLRGLDREKELLDAAVTSYERALELTQNRFRGGIASQSDVALAETQLEATRAQSVDLGVERAALEHAVALLIGQPASTFSLENNPLTATPPPIPVGLPSQLLERRPDIAAAERRVAAANADVGVATAAYYPLIALSGTIGFEASSFGSWLATASRFWTVGPSALVTVFDGGRRRAVADQARASLEESAAQYRESVLTAFREVEDQLAALRILDEEASIQQRAVEAATRSLQQATNRYRGGLVSYLEVTTAQSAALANERTAVDILTRRMTASVLLMKGLGGGWDAATLTPP